MTLPQPFVTLILNVDDTLIGRQSMFRSTRPGNAYQRVVTQLSWLGTIARKGALFDVIGRKKGTAG